MKIFATLSVLTVLLLPLAQITETLNVGQRVGAMTTTGVLGTVAVVCVIAVVFLAHRTVKDFEDVKQLVRDNTKALTEHAAATNAVAAVLVELKDAVRNCETNQKRRRENARDQA